MSFALDIKHEVLNQEFSKEQADAFILGLISSAGAKTSEQIIIKLNASEISNIIRDLLIQLKIKYTESNENKNWIVINDFKYSQSIKMPSQFFAGVFVGGGSISDPSSTSYHLEIQMFSHYEAERIQKFLNKYSFQFTLIQRRKRWVLYLKKSEHISDFLKAIQAFRSMVAFEDERITRDFQNQLNRYSNLDAYNQQKLARASESFKSNYNYIKANNLLSSFRDSELKFFDTKIKNPYSSLAELVEIYNGNTGLNKTRAGLNHWIIKLKKIASEN